MHETLIQTLAKVDRPGDVCIAGDLPLTMPGLVVDGLGILRLPLGETQAHELIACCRQAPYGKGTKTLVDTNVRSVWELDPGQFQIANPDWDRLIDLIIGKMQQKLGLKKRKLIAHLYKLLVYEQGSFFLPHRDGEKLDRMVATLVVVLPSVHEGGVLIISHDGHQREITFTGAASGYELSYAAFYADCQHEVRPLKSGYRLCLIYNVTLAKSRGVKGITAPLFDPVVEEIARLIAAWRNNPDSQKLAVLLDHRYTQDGLSPDRLKGVDRSRAEVLFKAAQQSDCVAHLALVTLWQHGTAECDWEPNSYGGGYRSRRSDDDGDGAGDEYEMGEIFDTSLSADHWSDHQGKKVLFGRIRLDETQIVADAALDDGDPGEEEFEGYTGNAGMTLERWYRRAAVVFWPREEHFNVLCGAGTDASIGGLEPMVKRLRRMSKACLDEQRQQCLIFAAAIIDAWQPGQGRYSGDTSGEIDRDVFPGLLCELDDPGLVRRFLRQVVSVDGGIQLDSRFTNFCEQSGWPNFEKELLALIEATQAETIARNAELLRVLCEKQDTNADRIALCERLCAGFVEALEAFDRQRLDNNWRVRPVSRTALLVSLVTAMLAIDARLPLSRLIDHALRIPNKYKLTATHLAAIFTLEPRLGMLTAHNKAISHWLASCRQTLQVRTAVAPQEPVDFRRANKLSCNCTDCSELSRFLASPDQCEKRMKLNKDRRRHLHDIIRSSRYDLTHVTERQGRPFTLVCTKTTASYQRACKINERDLSNLSRIKDLENRSV